MTWWTLKGKGEKEQKRRADARERYALAYPPVASLPPPPLRGPDEGAPEAQQLGSFEALRACAAQRAAWPLKNPATVAATPMPCGNVGRFAPVV